MIGCRDGEESSVRYPTTRMRSTAMAAKDPICGMTIEESDAVGSSEYEGTTYYFCSMDCKEEFDANPSDYAA